MPNQFYIPNSSLILPYTSLSISGLLSASLPRCLFFSPWVLIKHLFIEQWTGTSPDCPTLSRSVSISPLTPFSQSVNLNFVPVSLIPCFAMLTDFLESAKSPYGTAQDVNYRISHYFTAGSIYRTVSLTYTVCISLWFYRYTMYY